MELDGISYHDQPLKIRRPNDYNPAAVKDVGPIPKLNVNALYQPVSRMDLEIISLEAYHII